jgi:hypothetical protein
MTALTEVTISEGAEFVNATANNTAGRLFGYFVGPD